MTLRIAITGPESSGKSWLTERLGRQYDCPVVTEYSRTYLKNVRGRYTLSDILAIAKGQRESELRAIAGHSPANHPFIFCDTEPIVTKIWAEHVFGRCPAWIIRQIKENPHDFYLLCNIEVPWEADPLREHPFLREHFYNLFIDDLKRYSLPFAIVSGFGELRFQNAVQIIDRWFADSIH